VDCDRFSQYQPPNIGVQLTGLIGAIFVVFCKGTVLVIVSFCDHPPGN